MIFYWLWHNISIVLVATVISFIISFFVLRWHALKRITPYKLSSFKLWVLANEDEFKDKIEDISTDEPVIDLSIVFPAYNEEKRLEKTLNETLKFLQERKRQQEDFTYEMIIVDDGSKDDTSGVAKRYMKSHYTTEKDNIRLLPLVKNYGKGFAVKQGVIRARGREILMADADAATEISDLERLEKRLRERSVGSSNELFKKKGIAIGSRSHLEEQQDATARRNFIRKFISWIFNQLVAKVAGIKRIKDTQCGFKLFTRESARLLFLNLHVDRWCFDIELLIVADRFKIPVEEVPVNWQEIEGSHLNMWGMATTVFDLFLIRVNHLFGFWKITEKPSLRK